MEALGVTEGAVTQKVPLGPTKGAEMGWGVRSPPDLRRVTPEAAGRGASQDPQRMEKREEKGA